MQKILLALGLLISSSFSQFHDMESTINSILLKNRGILFSDSRNDSVPFLDFASELKRELEVGFAFNDIYREWTANKTLMNASQYGYDLGLRIPIKWFKKAGVFNTRVSPRYLNFTDRDESRDAQYSISDYPTYFIDNSILLSHDKHQFGLSVSAILGSGKTRLNINRFPNDEEDDLLNRYFYNLLEPTIGKKIHFNAKFRQFSLLVKHRYKINKKAQYEIRLGMGKGWDAFDFSYFTTTEKIKGQKNFKGPFNSNQLNIGLGLHLSHKLFYLHPAIFYNKSRYDFHIKADNPVKSGDIFLEFLELGFSEYLYSGFGGGIGISTILSGSVLLEGGLTFLRKDIEGDGNFTTPVLGFEILPIAHQFNGTYRGEMPMLLFHGQFSHRLNQFIKYKLLADYANSKLDLKYNAYAEMEFGIGDTRKSGLSTYFIDIYRLGIDALIRINNKWKVSPKVVQIIPDIRGKKEKKPSVAPPTEKKKKKFAWGGTFYVLGFLYNF